MAPQAAFAWHDPGHMATAVIAYNDLGPVKAHQVADILRHHEYYAMWMKDKPAGINEDEYLFMKASTWPDAIRSKDAPLGDHQYSRPSWHYIDNIYDLDNQPLPPASTDEHIVQAEAENIDIVEHSADQAARARALCWIFHLVGDIHMPLHATSLVSPQFPNGDAGGNAMYVTTSDGPQSVHFFWDALWDKETVDSSGKTDFTGYVVTDPNKVLPLANRIEAAYPRANLPELASDPSFADWAKESFDIAIDDVYLHGTLQASTQKGQGPMLPPGYEAQSKRIGECRLALAGYRLADTLRSTLGL